VSRSIRRQRQRGAGLVEYALGVSFVGVALLVSIGTLNDSAADELADRGGSIGYPTEAPTGSGGSGSGPVIPEEGLPDEGTEPPPYTGSIEGNCNGNDGAQDNCSFSLNPNPPAGMTVVWAVNPNMGYTGTPPTVTFTDKQTRTIQATVGGSTTLSRTVTCKIQAAKLRCSLS